MTIIFHNKMIKLILIVSIIIQLNYSIAKSLKFKPHIYKGNLALDNQFPWMAYLRIFPSEDDYSYSECGGTLIDDRHIITAAHCLYVDENTLVQPADIYTQLNITEKPWPMKNFYPTEKYFIHPKFNISQDWIMGDDLAILRLVSPVDINPICIPSEFKFTDGQDLISIGFGFTDADNSDENIDLNFVHVNFIAKDKCEYQRKKFSDEQLKNGNMKPYQVPELLETQLCAINDKTRGDTCPGDSGGPLIHSDNSRDTLVGVVTGSWTDCGSAQVPGIYTWISKYLDWIKSNGVQPCE